MARVHLVTINQSIPPLNQATFQRHSFSVDQNPAADRWSNMSEHRRRSRMRRIRNLLSVSNMPTGRGLTMRNRPPCAGKWLSSSCCHGLPGRTPIRISTGSLLTHLNPPTPTQPPTFKSSVTFSGGWLVQACAEERRGEADQGREGRWEVLIPSEGGPARLWPSLPALASPLTYHIHPPPPPRQINVLLRATDLTPIHLH